MNSSAIIVLLKAVTLMFIEAFLATFIPLATGLLGSGSTDRAAWWAVVVASIASGFRAFRGILTNLTPTDQAIN